MPSIAELRKNIKSYKNSQSMVRTIESDAAGRRIIVKNLQEQKQPHFVNAQEMLNAFTERDPLLTLKHPLATPRPNAPNIHIFLLSVDRTQFCQSPAKKQIKYIQEKFPKDSTIFTPLNKKAETFVRKINGTIKAEELIPINVKALEEAVRHWTPRIIDAFTHPDVRSVHIIGISADADAHPSETILLPIPVRESAYSLRTGISVEGTAPDVFTPLFQEYIKTGIYYTFLQTIEAENYSRMTTAHGAKENIEGEHTKLRTEMNKMRKEQTTRQMQELSQYL
jgi:F0F1-type ATP synthase gamma subunit